MQAPIRLRPKVLQFQQAVQLQGAFLVCAVCGYARGDSGRLPHKNWHVVAFSWSGAVSSVWALRGRRHGARPFASRVAASLYSHRSIADNLHKEFDFIGFCHGPIKALRSTVWAGSVITRAFRTLEPMCVQSLFARSLAASTAVLSPIDAAIDTHTMLNALVWRVRANTLRKPSYEHYPTFVTR